MGGCAYPGSGRAGCVFLILNTWLTWGVMMSAWHDLEREVAVLRSADLAGGDVPREVMVAPWGAVESSNGAFVVDEEGGRLVIAAFEAQGTDLPIDYEHQTLGGGYASPTGQAPAAGWIKRLFVRPPPGPARTGDEAGQRQGDGGEEDRPPGLYADVEWTEPARGQLAARQYRYLSPVAVVRKSDRRLVALHSAALTNKPAIVGMEAIVNRSDEGADSRDDARTQRHGETEVYAMTEALDRLRGVLGLDGASEATAVLLAASERIASLTDAARQSEAETRVVAAMEAGKLTEGQREWAVALAMKDPAAFEAWEASAPVVVQVGRIDADAEHGHGTAARVDGAAGDRERVLIAAKARAEFRANPELELLTSEEAYVALAMREANRRPC